MFRPNLTPKHRFPMKFSAIPALSLALFTAPAVLRSATVFDYNSTSYVTATQLYSRTATSSDNAGVHTVNLPYSNSTVLNPLSNYTGPSFYGGMNFTTTSSVGVNTRVINDFNNGGATTKDSLVYNTGIGAVINGTQMTLAGVYVFKQSSFQSGFTSGFVGIDGFSTTTINYGNGNYNPVGRWLIQTSGTFYLSQATIALGASGASVSNSLSGAGLSSTLWAVYDPSTSLNFDQSTASFGALSLTNITAAGLYFECDLWTGSTSSGNQGADFLSAVQTFTVTGVPEPNAAGLICLSLGGFVGVAAWKRKRSFRN